MAPDTNRLIYYINHPRSFLKARGVLSFFFSLRMKCCFVLCCLLLCQPLLGQVDTLTPPFKRFPALPPLQILLGDSVTKYNRANYPKKKPVLLMLFSPDCSHCQHTAEELVQYKEEIKDLHIVMSTLHPLWQMNAFVQKYGLADLKNVVVGKDIYYFMPSFYNVKNMPFLAMYNKKGALIYTFEGSLPLSRILQVYKEHK